MQKHVKPIAKTVGIGNVNWQILRRTFVTHNAPHDPKAVQGIVGHANLDSTQNVYQQHELDRMKALLEAHALRLGMGETHGVQ